MGVREQPVWHGHGRRARLCCLRDPAESGGLLHPQQRVDGMDVLAVRQATLDAFEISARKARHTSWRLSTYRFRGHSMGDPERYRTPEEVKKWQENDPIGIYVRRLLAEKIAGRRSWTRWMNLSRRRWQKPVDLPKTAQNQLQKRSSSISTPVHRTSSSTDYILRKIWQE